MRLIVGLGNPGSEHANNRHNVGFMVVDRLATRHRMIRGRSRFHGELREGRVTDTPCMLLKPMTYMNRSGLAVGEVASFYRLDFPCLLVVLDDTALPLGRIRLRPGGGDGGHNGLADIERALGTTAYPRLRVGIGAPGQAPQVDYVLGHFTAAQRAALDSTLDIACEAIEDWLCHGIESAMNRYNPGRNVETPDEDQSPSRGSERVD